ncbi:protein Wnt-11b-like [Branchiostoma lanceolatum]|uniref:protein Wnt-11b-like n=1 Tax=Branchiostoma lanceolatum TaxID=7740 RepID=UPI0034532149
MDFTPVLWGILLLVFIDGRSSAIKWLSIADVGKNLSWNKTSSCRKVSGFVPGQTQLCRRTLEVMPAVEYAAEAARKTCQEQFGNRRWNCSSIKKAPHFMNDLEKGTKEAAYVHALSSAALVHTVARACAAGYLKACSCARKPGEKPDGNYTWGGCGDNVKFGLEFGTGFADAPMMKRKRSHTQTLMNLHNSGAGRMAVQNTMTTKCKCHGVSGSCNVKTCWKSLADLTEISHELAEKYSYAIKMVKRKIGTRQQLVPEDRRSRRHSSGDLIFVDKSPDYCIVNNRKGSYGTTGRLCNKTSVGPDSCQTMCCGRGHNDFTTTVTERCNCKYHWCCYVTCDECTRTEVKSMCK